MRDLATTFVQFAFWVGLGLAILSPGTAKADMALSFNATYGTSPATPPVAPPWLSAFFQEVPGTGTQVQLTLTNLLPESSEFISGVYFNIGGDHSGLMASGFGGSGESSLIGVRVGSFFAAGGGAYDISLDFDTSNAGRFTTGETLTMTFTRASGLLAADFDVLAAPHGGAGPFVAAAHVQGIDGSGSWIAPSRSASVEGALSPAAVPEPGSVFLLGTAALAVIQRMWKRRTFVTSALSARS